MTLKRLFVLNGAIAAGYGIALLVAAGPILDLYGITPNPEGAYMARWFGVGLLAIGLTTWSAREAAESAGGQAITRSLTVTYGVGVVRAVGHPVRPLQRAGMDRGGPEPAAGLRLRRFPVQQAEGHIGHEDLSGGHRLAVGHLTAGSQVVCPTTSGRQATTLDANICSMSKATILHADLDAFYASVEQRDDPRLRGRPVIVGAGVVLAASYEAKAHGVRTAMGGAQARRLCPQAVVVPPRMGAYAKASKAVFEVFRQTTPLVEGLSIDEAFLDVGGLRRVSGTPTEIAARLRSEVGERVGLPITVGVARTKFLAKVASGVAKPNGLLVVPPEGELAFLHPLPVERLWGVGPVTAGKLRDRGITTVGEVARLG
jgi:impB/mucB/samB family protein/IMS family protein with HHH motif